MFILVKPLTFRLVSFEPVIKKKATNGWQRIGYPSIEKEREEKSRGDSNGESGSVSFVNYLGRFPRVHPQTTRCSDRCIPSA